jgi:hypothetical protein
MAAPALSGVSRHINHRARLARETAAGKSAIFAVGARRVPSMSP